jgi:hypothetical protein
MIRSKLSTPTTSVASTDPGTGSNACPIQFMPAIVVWCWQQHGETHTSQKDRSQQPTAELDHLVGTLETVKVESEAVDFGDSLDRFRTGGTTTQEAIDTSDRMMPESGGLAGALTEQAAERNEVSSRTEQLNRYARPLGEILVRFETEAERRYVFSSGSSQGVA